MPGAADDACFPRPYSNSLPLKALCLGRGHGLRTSLLGERLSDTRFTVAGSAEDIHDRTVVDQKGKDIGGVKDQLIDVYDRRVRFLEITSGGFHYST
jgi:hypothetical protein